MPAKPAAANAAPLSCDRSVLESYIAWLHMEQKRAAIELYRSYHPEETDSEVLRQAAGHVPQTHRIVDWFHFPEERDWRSVVPPSARAELVLRTVGLDPKEITAEEADNPRNQ